MHFKLFPLFTNHQYEIEMVRLANPVGFQRLIFCPQYKIAESPVPSEEEEEESEEEDDGFGPKKPAVDPDDPVARKFLLLSMMMMLLLDVPKKQIQLHMHFCCYPHCCCL